MSEKINYTPELMDYITLLWEKANNLALKQFSFIFEGKLYFTKWNFQWNHWDDPELFKIPKLLTLDKTQFDSISYKELEPEYAEIINKYLFELI